jgi:hypothetical protein
VFLSLHNTFRAILLALAFAVHTADVRAAERPAAHTTAHAAKLHADRTDDTLGGVLMVVGLVGAVVVFAWVCSRVADNRSTV